MTTTFGAMLRLWRLSRRQTVRQVALEIGIGSATLSRIERGGPCEVETWLKLQRWLFATAGEE